MRDKSSCWTFGRRTGDDEREGASSSQIALSGRVGERRGDKLRDDDVGRLECGVIIIY